MYMYDAIGSARNREEKEMVSPEELDDSGRKIKRFTGARSRKQWGYTLDIKAKRVLGVGSQEMGRLDNERRDHG